MATTSGRRVPQELRGRVQTRIRSIMNPYIKGDAGHMKQAAYDIGVHPSCIWFWYNGWTIPMIHNLIKFADYYDVSVDYLLGRTHVKELTKGLRVVSGKRKAA